MGLHTHFAGTLVVDFPNFIQTHPATLGAAVARSFHDTLMAGFTSVRDVGSWATEVAPLVDQGIILGPNVFGAGAAIGITGGSCDACTLPGDFVSTRQGTSPSNPWPGVACLVNADGVDECRLAVRQQIRRGARCIKVVATGGILSTTDDPKYRQYSDEELSALMDESKLQGRAVAVHAHGKAGVTAAIRAGAHTIEHGSYIDDEAAELMVSRGVTLVATRKVVEAGLRNLDTLNPPTARKMVAVAEQHRRAYSTAVRKGVKIALGTDICGSDPKSDTAHGKNGAELVYAVQAGLSPLQAIEAATVNSAETLGPQTPKKGLVKVGWDADLIALDENPLEDIRVFANSENISQEIGRGRNTKSRNLATAFPHDEKSVANGDIEEDDQFAQLSGVEPYDGRRLLTVRAVFSGVILGSLISCSNLYLGLKTGFGADATLFSAIFGYGICKLLEKSKIPYLSAPFGPHENIIQATSLGCIGIGFMFISGVPAMYQLKLLGDNVQSDYGRMLCFTLVAGFWGLGFAVPLRSLFILRLARQLSLYFPLGTASAIVIRALHSVKDGSSKARDNIKTISISFSTSFVWSVCTSYAPGILYTWNPFWWIYKWGGKGIISAVNWGWITWSWSPSLIGIGMMIDLNASLSYLLGSVLAWGVIGPVLVKTGAAVGLAAFPNYPDMVTYNAFIPDQFDTTPSPRYWVLWPAIFMMLATSLTSILYEARGFARLAKLGGRQLRRRFAGRREEDSSLMDRDDDDGIPDPIAKEHRVRWWEWTSISIASLVFSLVALKYLFGIPPALNLLNLVLGFFWSFVVIQVYAASGTLATGTIAKGTQFITGGVLNTEVGSRGYDSAARINLVGTSVAAAAMQQSAELCQDFRTGFLLRTPACPQWYAQMIGTLTAVFLAPALFMLFARAYPCILDPASTTCQFALPAVTSWRVVTEAVLAERFPITQSSWVFTIIASAAGIGSVTLKRWLSAHSSLSSWAVWVPNMSLVGLAMTIPGTSTTMSIAIGSVGAHLWARLSPDTHARFFYPTAAGGVAGEGVGYVVLSVLQIAQVGGPTYFGTKLGCVAESC
ncbi:hypothetical protein ACJ41O_005773 [Fusarium nematophilum]